MKTNIFKLSVFSISVLAMTALNVSANDDVPDPADVTKVLTALKVSVGTNSNDYDAAVEAELKIGGSFNKNNSFLTMISAQGATKDSAESMDADDFDLREYRARWFQVFGTGMEGMPKAGYSIDYIDHSNDDSDPIDNIVAVGGVVKIPVLSNWVMYPNIAVVQANLKDEYKINGSDDGKGFQLNIFNSIYLSKKGTYLMINPQYSWLDFDTYTTQDLLIETTFGMPLTESRKWWFSATYKETFSDVSFDNKSIAMPDVSYRVNDDKRQFRIGVTYIF